MKHVKSCFHISEMENIKEGSFPTFPPLLNPLNLYDGKSVVNANQYISIIGALQLLSMKRSDIAYIINRPQFIESPSSHSIPKPKKLLNVIVTDNKEA